MPSLCLCSKVTHALKGLLLSRMNDAQKQIRVSIGDVFSLSLSFSHYLVTNADIRQWIHSLKGWRGWESQGGNQNNSTAEKEKEAAISLYSWGPCTYTYTEPRRPWATAKELPNITQKATSSGKVHLRKHPGTGQGPAAEGSWSALSHWCASVQRPCKSSTKEPHMHKEK